MLCKRLFRSACSVLARCGSLAVVAVLVLNVNPVMFAQTESATVLGRVTDPTGAVIGGVEVEIRNIDTNVAVTSITNSDGLYTITSLRPGRYVMSLHKTGFKTISVTGINLNIQDNLVRNFLLQIGAVSESVTVTADSGKINTTDGALSTVVDRDFAENLPMNGRSFQTLIELTPGVVVTPVSTQDQGQFTVNGQRAASNYWMVDGVSANVGVSSAFTPGNGLAGTVPASTALGGTNGLVSVDAMEEFRIQTSTYAPEFGRSPGGQISIATRSGTNQFHGTAFDFLRNDIFDAKDWFSGFTNNPPLPKAEERQNDFGGTFSGPIWHERTFFFFSYEGLRLRLPQTLLSTVPDLTARENALPAMQPFLNAFPLPNGQDLGNGVAQFNSSFSNQSTLDAVSLRVDHKIGRNLMMFARYSYAPSQLLQRGGSLVAANVLFDSAMKTQSGTVGATWNLSPLAVNDVRLNYSRTSAASQFKMDGFGGATPLPALPFPPSLSTTNSTLDFTIFSLTNILAEGHNAGTEQRQINLVDTFSIEKGTHALKFGLDFRRLTPIYSPAVYTQQPSFFSVAAAESGTVGFSLLTSSQPATLLFRNVGTFAQDTWKIIPRLTATYGIRWDIDFSPTSIDGPFLPAVNNFDLSDLSGLSLASARTPLYRTPLTDFAPRIGLAYQLSGSSSWQSVLRGGFGIFFDSANSEIGNDIASSYPFFAFKFPIGGGFPLSSGVAAPPPINANGATITAVDPRLGLPRTYEWNFTLDQMLGKVQTLSLSYVGAVGRNLLQTAVVQAPTPSFAQAVFITNAATSDYHALQAQFHRRVTNSLQLLASYSWSHSIDTASAGSIGTTANELAPTLGANRGPSSFDIRNAFSAGATYEIPSPKDSAFEQLVLHGWSIQSLIQARSAAPVDVTDGNFFLTTGGFRADVRPDLVSGQPLYLFGAQFPGGKAINPTAFIDPPKDPTTGFPLRQGTTPRNFLRGFGAAQWDCALHRSFPIHDSLQLQFRAEFFNLLNHPNFGPPKGSFGVGGFGLSSQMLGTSLAGGSLSGGGLAPLYQIGGPRSGQLALKLIF